MKRLHFLRVLFHAIGLATLTAAIIAQLLMLEAIRRHGIFIAIEPNRIVCHIELAVTILGAAYLIYLFITTIKKLRTATSNKVPNASPAY